jgi:hypothetical protein
MTDATVATKATRQARVGAASTMGMINMSGGIGKTEDSMKAIAARAHSACRWPARESVQS